MKSWLRTLGLTALLACQVLSNDIELVSPCALRVFPPLFSFANATVKKSDEAHRQRCSGMYSRKAWGGNVDPFILVQFSKRENQEGDPLASLVIFEWNDEDLIGEYRSNDAEVRISREVTPRKYMG